MGKGRAGGGKGGGPETGMASLSFIFCHVTSSRGRPVIAPDFPRHWVLFQGTGARLGLVYCISLTISFELQAWILQLKGAWLFPQQVYDRNG